MGNKQEYKIDHFDFDAPSLLDGVRGFGLKDNMKDVFSCDAKLRQYLTEEREGVSLLRHVVASIKDRNHNVKDMPVEAVMKLLKDKRQYQQEMLAAENRPEAKAAGTRYFFPMKWEEIKMISVADFEARNRDVSVTTKVGGPNARALDNEGKMIPAGVKEPSATGDGSSLKWRTDHRVDADLAGLRPKY